VIREFGIRPLTSDLKRMASYGGGRQGKSFIVTLGIGIFFGFGFAYMILQSNGPLNLPPPDASQQVIIIK
jgi:hypothetical protein